MKVSNWLTEPLLHFLFLGALIFVVYNAMNPSGPADNEIVVTRGQQEALVMQFTKAWNRPPTASEFEGIIKDWIREEVAYRQALEMGLDGNDTIVRRRLRQKLELLAEDIVSMAPPTTEDLEAYRAAKRADYMLEPRYTLQQVFFSPDRRGEAAVQDAEQALVLLRANTEQLDTEQIGDPISLPQRVVAASDRELKGLFGQVFTTELEGIEPGSWAGPLNSGYGVHLVYIEKAEPGRELTLEEAQAEVRRDWENTRRIETIDRLYERLVEDYSITIESFEANGEVGP
jgi:hypothetical protein